MALPNLLEVAATSAVIADLAALEAYESRCVVPPPEEAALQAMPDHLSLTNVFMIPGRSNPDSIKRYTYRIPKYPVT